MLSRPQAIDILKRHGQDAAWIRHCHVVAQAAAGVGEALGHGREVDIEGLWSFALLHDIGRSVTHDPVLHGVEGYRIMTALGHGDAAFVCASHVLFGLQAAEAAAFGLPARDFVPRTDEERIVPLVDFLLEGDEPTTLERRFSSLRERNAANEWFVARLDRAHADASGFMAHLDAVIGRPVQHVVTEAARYFMHG